jgi:hypothetical protein
VKTAASYLLLGLLGVTGFIFWLVSIRKENRRAIFWFTLAIMCLGAMVLFADYLEEVRALERISRHVEAMIRGL